MVFRHIGGRPPVIFQVYGESNHDRATIRNLAQALLHPTNASFELLRQPIVLRRNAGPPKRKEMTQNIAAFWRARSGQGNTVVVVLHRDCDAVEPAHLTEKNEIRRSLNAAGVPVVVVAAPAWEIETWPMLFPAALRRTRSCWRQVNYRSSNVGLIANAKEKLKRDLRPVGSYLRAKCPDYTESDSVVVSQEIQRDPTLINHITAVSNSFEEFKLDLVYAKVHLAQR